MKFQTILVIVSFVIAVMLALGIIPVLRKKKMGQSERDDGPKSHLSKKGTPTMGGIIFIICILVMSISTCIITKNYDILALAFASIGFGCIGMFDDYKKLVQKDTKGLSPKGKMIGLLAISIIYILYIIKFANIGTSTYIPFFKIYINIPIFIYIPCAIFIILGTTNAFNLTDGVDGLATTVSLIVITCITGIAMMKGVEVVATFGSILIGMCLAFLIFNLHPAKVFMGDTGSLLLGGAVVTSILYLRMPLLLIIIALIPVCETLSVIIQVAYFRKTGNRIFKMAPIHHHFELSGWSENKVVSVFSIATLILCIVGLIAV